MALKARHMQHLKDITRNAYQVYLDTPEEVEKVAPVLSLVSSMPLTGYERLRVNVEKHLGTTKNRAKERTQDATNAALRLCK